MKLDGILHSVLGAGLVGAVASMPLVIHTLVFPDTSRGAIGVGLLSLFCASVGGGVLSYRLYRRAQRLEESVSLFVEGDLDSGELAVDQWSMSGASDGLDRSLSELRERLRSLSRMSREQDAILRSMNEGVITVDSLGRIVRVNEAARSLLGIRKAYVEALPLEVVITQDEVRMFIREAISSMLPKTISVSLGGNNPRVFDVYGSPLFQDDGSSSGTLIVIRDMTRVHALEAVRRDFVANVSHELKTPVTSIKGFAETLLDGAMDDPEALKKFLGIIAKHAERLHTIFNDLLTLAKLEAGGEQAHIELMPYKLATLVRDAIEVCSSAALAGRVTVSSAVADDVVVVVNPNLVQQALVNLIDNAIKYSHEGASVQVTAELQGEFARCMVVDNGPGIESSHVPRLFERFYRVDHGRSRQMGGTGLGLSIVKHIAQAHGGRVGVESSLGQGSTFSIYLKARP